MPFAAGTRGRPGIVIISPVKTTINSAPNDNRISRTGKVNPVGAHFCCGSEEKLYWVLAIQIGKCPYPSCSKISKLLLNLFGEIHIIGPVNVSSNGSNFFCQGPLVWIEYTKIRRFLLNNPNHLFSKGHPTFPPLWPNVQPGPR